MGDDNTFSVYLMGKCEVCKETMGIGLDRCYKRPEAGVIEILCKDFPCLYCCGEGSGVVIQMHEVTQEEYIAEMGEECDI